MTEFACQSLLFFWSLFLGHSGLGVGGCVRTILKGLRHSALIPQSFLASPLGLSSDIALCGKNILWPSDLVEWPLLGIVYPLASFPCIQPTDCAISRMMNGFKNWFTTNAPAVSPMGAGMRVWANAGMNGFSVYLPLVSSLLAKTSQSPYILQTVCMCVCVPEGVPFCS